MDAGSSHSKKQILTIGTDAAQIAHTSYGKGMERVATWQLYVLSCAFNSSFRN